MRDNFLAILTGLEAVFWVFIGFTLNNHFAMFMLVSFILLFILIFYIKNRIFLEYDKISVSITVMWSLIFSFFISVFYVFDIMFFNKNNIVISTHSLYLALALFMLMLITLIMLYKADMETDVKS